MARRCPHRRTKRYAPVTVDDRPADPANLLHEKCLDCGVLWEVSPDGQRLKQLTGPETRWGRGRR